MEILRGPALPALPPLRRACLATAFILAVIALVLGMWQVTLASLALPGVFILWLIVAGTVGGQLLTALLASIPAVHAWARRDIGDRLTFWLFAQVLLGVCVVVLCCYLAGALPPSSPPAARQASHLASAAGAASHSDVARWRRLVDEAARRTWVFAAVPPLGVVDAPGVDPALDPDINAWSSAWGGVAMVGATPAMLSLPESSMRAAIAHEMGHIALASGDTLASSTRSQPLSVLSDVACMAILAVVLVLVRHRSPRLLAALVLANAVAWLTLLDVDRWASSDRQAELAADGYAIVWSSSADMARALVAAAGACSRPRVAPGRFDDHPPLDVRLEALGTTLPAVCQGLLEPQPS